MGEILNVELMDVRTFKNIITTAEQILTEVKFEADNDGIRFRGLDGGHTCFFIMELDRDYFESYSIDSPESIIIDTGELLKVIKRVKNDNILSIKFNDSEMIIKAYNDNNSKEFKIYAVDMEYESPHMPNIPFEIESKIDYSEFRDNIGDAKLYEDVFTLKSSNGGINVVSKSMFGEYNSKLVSECETVGCESRFSVKLVEKFFKLNSISDELIIKMGGELPLLLCFEEDNLRIQYMIAPRVSED